MLDLLKVLTEDDNKIIENYIHYHGIEEGYIGNNYYLQYWANSKKKLFRLLNGQLIYKVPYTYEKPKTEINREMRKLVYSQDVTDIIEIVQKAITNNPKFEEYTYPHFVDLFSTNNFIDNKILYEKKFSVEGKKELVISVGMKPIRAILKVINYFGLGSDSILLDKIEKLRIAISMIFNDKKIKGNLCFSIHPMDFMTMSDNASDWSSCMSWTADGCYHAGTVEMMNSNNVICVYLESKKPFIFALDEDYNFKKETEDVHEQWNNKKWRQLFYVTKDIIVSGKPYPYVNEEITKFALNALRTLAKDNWNHEYQFGIELYKDMIHINSQYAMDKARTHMRYSPRKHNIIFDTKAMYNDMFNDNATSYWCVRNKVDKNKIISYSGKCPCLKCLDTVYYDNDDYYSEDDNGYNERFKNTGSCICSSCMDDAYCSYCEENTNGKYKMYEVEINGHIERMCAKCLSSGIVSKCPCCENYVFVDNRPLKQLYIALEGFKYPTEETTLSMVCYSQLAKRVPMCDECAERYIEDGNAYEYEFKSFNWSNYKKKIYISKEMMTEQNYKQIYKTEPLKFSEIKKID